MIWIVLVIAPWVFLLLFWGRFWRADARLPAEVDFPRDPGLWPDVQILIPARNEAASIAQIVEAHRKTDYPGTVRLLVIDDNSSDGTGDLARKAGARVVSGAPLPAGWSGKLWALQQGMASIADGHSAPEWILLTDADILHAPDTLRRLVATGEALKLDLVSLMARLDTSGVWGALLIPAFVFFFQKLYPFNWVNRPGHWCAGAAGGCVLVRADALHAIGGLAAMRDALIDDCTLARRIKRIAPRRAIWLGLADREVVSLRDNSSFQSVWAMVKRTAFTQLRHSWLLMLGSILGLMWLYLGWLGLVIHGLSGGGPWAVLAGLVTWTLIAVAYWPNVRLLGLGLAHAFTLPFVAVLYGAMTFASAVDHLRGRGGAWKGRTYPE